eukprot:15473845-Alexandrium_andersonii.AAC.1
MTAATPHLRAWRRGGGQRPPHSPAWWIKLICLSPSSSSFSCLHQFTPAHAATRRKALLAPWGPLNTT